MKPASLPTALLALLLLAGCGGPTALDLTLVADPNVNSTADLVRQLQSLKLVVSSDEGLYAPPPPSPGPEVKLEDIDGSGRLSLIAERSVAGLDHLPRIRLERGSIRSVALELRLEGNPCPPSDPSCQGKLSLAAGGVKGVRFADGAAQQLQVPFNTRLYYRQPQVTQVNPEDGASGLSPSFDSVAVIFSKKMNPDSVQAPGVLSVVRVDGGTETDVPPRQPVTLTNLGGDESPALATYFFLQPLQPGSYRIKVSTGALDFSGRHLDQVPMQPGDQPFSSSFAIGTKTGQALPTCSPCPSWCSEGGENCAPGLTCDRATRTCKPQCPATCPSLTVCDPSFGVCRPDCRLYGSYGGCAAGETCQASGVCQK